MTTISQEPIFILGYPRSGTTLLQMLLSTQKEFVSFPETHFFSTFISTIKTDENNIIINKCDLSKILKKNILCDTVWEDTIIYNTLNNLENLNIKELFESIIKHYLKNNKQRWIEKTPNHIYMIDLIKKFYPNAKFLFLIRHPFDAIHSRKMKLPHDKTRSVELLAQYWINSLIAYENFKLLFPNSIMLIKYEELATNYKKSIKELEDFLDFSINDSLLQEYPNQLKTLVHPWETWKMNNKNKIKKMPTQKFSKEFCNTIEGITSHYMKKYGY